MNTLTGKCVWVTGATSGIGFALAKRLVGMGCFVIASGRNEAVLGELSLCSGGRLKPLVFDVACSQAAAQKVKDALVDMTDYIDVVICCAGVCEYEDDLLFESEMYERVMNVNFLGVVRTLNLAMPLLKRSEFTPHFAAVGSLSSVVGFPRAEAYGSSKAALEYFMRSLRADVSNIPFVVSLIRPGFVATPMTRENDFPMPLELNPDCAAEEIIRGLEKGKFIIDFPKRLSWGLRFLSAFSVLWWRLMAPSLTRHKAKAWR